MTAAEWNATNPPGTRVRVRPYHWRSFGYPVGEIVQTVGKAFVVGGITYVEIGNINWPVRYLEVVS
jgi:hypothetical protein